MRPSESCSRLGGDGEMNMAAQPRRRWAAGCWGRRAIVAAAAAVAVAVAVAMVAAGG